MVHVNLLNTKMKKELTSKPIDLKDKIMLLNKEQIKL